MGSAWTGQFHRHVDRTRSGVALTINSLCRIGREASSRRDPPNEQIQSRTERGLNDHRPAAARRVLISSVTGPGARSVSRPGYDAGTPE